MYRSHGNGKFEREDFKKIGKNVIFEKGVLVFHPENITIGNNVYIGHNTILEGYYKNEMVIGSGVWIGSGCFLHSAGGIVIEELVGIGPGVKILTSVHDDVGLLKPIVSCDLKFGKVIIGRGSDIGIGSIILPDVHICVGCIVGAGSVVTKNVPSYSVGVGNPLRVIRNRADVTLNHSRK